VTRSPGYKGHGDELTWHIFTECPHGAKILEPIPIDAKEQSSGTLCDWCRDEDRKSEESVPKRSK
jgi:hypothetical protein